MWPLENSAYAHEGKRVRKASHILYLSLYENSFGDSPQKSLGDSPGCPGPHFENHLKCELQYMGAWGDGVREGGARGGGEERDFNRQPFTEEARQIDRWTHNGSSDPLLTNRVETHHPLFLFLSL